MAFNGLEFGIFFSVFLLAIQLGRKHLLLGQAFISLFSFAFYYWAEQEFFPYMLFMCLVNFAFAQAIHRLPDQRKLLLSVILFLDVSFLIGGKLMGQDTRHFPLGISFFTFQLMSFLIDLYRGSVSLPQGVWHFHSYMFFFPHLLAGPICRAQGLLNQLGEKLVSPSFTQIRSGFYLISFGLFKKAVMADALAVRINEQFLYPQGSTGLISWSIVTIAYGFQIYFDFSGYTDMARGMAKLVGIELPLNFHFPYFARDLKDFWRRWHISLSQWFRDYVYIPLGGNQTQYYIFAIFVTFALSALWHGLAWTFLIWGLWHALWLVLFHYFFQTTPGPFNRALMLLVVFTGWLFFRAKDIDQLIQILSLISMPNSTDVSTLFWRYRETIILIALAIGLEGAARYYKPRYTKMSPLVTDLMWLALTLMALTLQAPVQEFIYARF